MNIQKLIENLRLISSVIPDYAEGRSRGLADEEIERLALEAVSEVIEFLEKHSDVKGAGNRPNLFYMGERNI